MIAELYGPDWKEFSHRIRFVRAGGRCECMGECDSESCNLERQGGRCRRRHGDPIWGVPTDAVTILTTAHLCHDPSCRDEMHVRAMCQRCHLSYDRHLHARNAAWTRDAKAGQGRLEL